MAYLNTHGIENLPNYDPEDIHVRQNQMKFSDFNRIYEYLAQLNSYNEIGSITSRDQIIDPYAIVDISNYRNTKKGQALYNADLARMKLIAERQEAAYKEWYESEQQQAERQREAGMNPNLNGVDAGMASDVEMDSGSPLDGIGTTGDTIGTIAGVAATAVGTIVSAVATLGALPATIAAAGVADATAAAVKSGTKFDFDAWSSNADSFKGIFESYAPSGVTIDDPRYGAAYNRAIKNIQKLKGSAFEINSGATTQQTDFARALADPYFDNDLLTQMAYLEPISEAMKQIDILSRQFQIAKLNLKKTYVDGLDGELASQDFNSRLQASMAKAGFDTNYYNGFDGDEVAALDLAIKQNQKIIGGCEAMIKAHFRDIWNDKSKPFAARAGALYQIMGGTPQNWKAWLVSYAAANGFQSVDDGKHTYQTDFLGDSAADILENYGNSLYSLP